MLAFTLVSVELLEFGPDFSGLLQPPKDCLLVGLLRLFLSVVLGVDIWLVLRTALADGAGSMFEVVVGTPENSR